jgi:hypothetical protein
MTEQQITWPKTREQLTRMRWQHVNFGICKGVNCKKRIEWWKTIDKAWMPLEKVFETGELANSLFPHWQSCVDAQNFKKPTDEPKAVPAAAKQTEMFK